jgi:hypothetical protein
MRDMPGMAGWGIIDASLDFLGFGSVVGGSCRAYGMGRGIYLGLYSCERLELGGLAWDINQQLVSSHLELCFVRR